MHLPSLLEGVAFKSHRPGGSVEPRKEPVILCSTK